MKRNIALCLTLILNSIHIMKGSLLSCQSTDKNRETGISSPIRELGYQTKQDQLSPNGVYLAQLEEESRELVFLSTLSGKIINISRIFNSALEMRWINSNDIIALTFNPSRPSEQSLVGFNTNKNDPLFNLPLTNSSFSLQDDLIVSDNGKCIIVRSGDSSTEKPYTLINLESNKKILSTPFDHFMKPLSIDDQHNIIVKQDNNTLQKWNVCLDDNTFHLTEEHIKFQKLPTQDARFLFDIKFQKPQEMAVVTNLATKQKSNFCVPTGFTPTQFINMGDDGKHGVLKGYKVVNYGATQHIKIPHLLVYATQW